MYSVFISFRESCGVYLCSPQQLWFLGWGDTLLFLWPGPCSSQIYHLIWACSHHLWLFAAALGDGFTIPCECSPASSISQKCHQHSVVVCKAFTGGLEAMGADSNLVKLEFQIDPGHDCSWSPTDIPLMSNFKCLNRVTESLLGFQRREKLLMTEETR